ncbi:MAG: TonB family protein [Acidobacteriota bacterium]|nr:TonB family protein [Acidobacteriota bacterium]
MSFGYATNSLGLLTEEALPATASLAQNGYDPQLGVQWGAFRQSFGSSVSAVLTGPTPSKKDLNQGFFRGCRIEGRIPRRAVVAAALWHVVFLAMPWPELPASLKRDASLDNFQLTWSGPINDLPPLKMFSAGAAPNAGVESPKVPVIAGADAFHPRQRISTDAEYPTHPRQMLINTSAPAIPPKILPRLPNIVQLAPAATPAKPRIEINEQRLAQLHPREMRATKVAAAPLPDVANAEPAPVNITMMALPNAPARPKLELNSGAPPRLTAQHAQSSEVLLAPEVGDTHRASANGNASTLFAISATSGPPAPSIPLPQGNLAARVTISPDGAHTGTFRPEGTGAANPAAIDATANHSGGPASRSAGSGAGKDSVTVSISGGNPLPKTGISGLGGNPVPKIAARGLSSKIDPRTKIEDMPERTGPPNFAALPPGAKPEQIFAAKKIYTMYVNMPNLNSATGSWVLNFSELRTNSGAHITSADLAGPVAIKKNDPKYPPTLINEHVEGEVVLYAVIRADGSVDSVELVRGLDQQLDANAMEALSQWKFRPASRQGVPVDLEAIVHIPFHAPSNDR